MPARLRLALLLLVLLPLTATGCGAQATEPDPEGGPPFTVTVSPLDAQTVHLRVDDLPPPFHTASASRGPRVVDVPAEPVLRLPPGFTVNVFAGPFDGPRTLALTPDGDVLVAASRADRLYRLRDADGDGWAEEQALFADAGNGLDRPFGMAFADGFFFAASAGDVRRWTYDDGQTRLDGPGEVITTFPSGGHWTRNLAVSADGQRLLAAVGSASNVSPEAAPRATIVSMALDGTDRRTWAAGLRNPVGLAVHPATGAVYTAVNERDGLGDDLVPDYFTRVPQDAFFGWPYAYLAPDLLDPRRSDDGASENPTLAARTRTPDVLFQAHSAPLGIALYDHDAFPAAYRGGAFVAFHGSWNRSEATGYKVVFVPFEGGTPRGDYQDFLTGFLLDPNAPTAWGRPVGLLAMPDGSLLLSEDGNGMVYRIRYTGTR